MPATLPHDDVPSGTTTAGTVPPKNLLLLAALRCVGVLGQSGAIAWVSARHEATLPVAVLGGIIGIQLLAACLAWYRARQASTQISQREWLFHLLFDATALSAMLFFAGGSTNPFVWLLLLPLIIVAATLPSRDTWLMAAVVAGYYTFLMFRYIPLPMAQSGSASEFHLHVMGMWGGFLMAAGAVAFFAGRMSDQRRQRSQEIVSLREQTLTDRYLARLGTQAAGAAHELGTPLATIAVIAKETARDYADDPDLAERMSILRGQVERCKSILSAIAAEGGRPRAEAGHRIPVDDYLHALIDNWKDMRPTAQVTCQLHGNDPTPTVWTEGGLGQALLSLLNNAADAGGGQPVEINVRWDLTELMIDVCDRGPGFPGNDPSAVIDPLFSTKDDGLGLGLFLTQAVIDQLGGYLQLSNRDGGGAVSRIVLPLSSLQTATA